MKKRYDIDDNAVIIERASTDYDFWKTLKTLHFIIAYYGQLERRTDLITKSCLEFLRKGAINDKFLSEILLLNALNDLQGTDNNERFFKKIVDVFGATIVDDLCCYRGLSRGNLRPEIFERRTEEVIVYRDIKLINERYSFSPDGYFLERYAIDNEFWTQLVALHYAYKRHFGKSRKDGSPYISHPERIGCDTIDRVFHLHITELLISLGLLHDTIEETDSTVEEIRIIFGDELASDVNSLSRKPQDVLSPELYYKGIKKAIRRIIVKAVDKENIAGDMIISLSTSGMLRQMREDLVYLFPMMKYARERYPEFRGLLFSCRNHILLDIINVMFHIKTGSQEGLTEENIGAYREIVNILVKNKYSPLEKIKKIML